MKTIVLVGLRDKMEKYTPKTANKAPVKFMAIGAHQDDVEIMALDGIFKGQSKDASFSAIVLADGAGCPKNQKYASLSQSEIMQLRIDEQKSASEIGGYNTLYLLKKSSAEIKAQGAALSFTALTNGMVDVKTTANGVESEIAIVNDTENKKESAIGAECNTESAIGAEYETASATDGEVQRENTNNVENATYSQNDAKNETFGDIVEQIRQILLENPCLDTLYIHNLCDKHPTHVSAGKIALFAVLSLPYNCRPKRVVGCEVWRSLDWLDDKDKVIFNLDENPKLAQELIAVFKSQNTAKGYDLGAKGRRLANATFGESHSENDASEIWLGMDLTPLILPNAPSVHDFLKEKIQNFENSVLASYRQ